MIDTLKLRTEKIPLSDTTYFSSTFLDYLDQNPKLNEFYGAYPTLDAFAELIENRKFSKQNRESLVKVLNQQYTDLVLSGKLIQNISALRQDNCFTITTGHQLNIFTGPLFFIYKIISTIKADLQNHCDGRFREVLYGRKKYLYSPELHSFRLSLKNRYARHTI